MKKYLMALATFLMFAGIVNAQVAHKPAAKQTSPAKTHTVEAKPTTTSSVTAPTAQAPGGKATIRRKHTHKKMKTQVK